MEYTREGRAVTYVHYGHEEFDTRRFKSITNGRYLGIKPNGGLWDAITNMTMNPMNRLMPGEKELIGRFMTTECLEDEFAMDFDGDFVQILNEGLVQQMLERNEVQDV